jgi:hypothetical protein
MGLATLAALVAVLGVTVAEAAAVALAAAALDGVAPGGVAVAGSPCVQRRRSSLRPSAFSIWRHLVESSGVSNVIAWPVRPMRPVRPTRWVNHSADSGSS